MLKKWIIFVWILLGVFIYAPLQAAQLTLVWNPSVCEGTCAPLMGYRVFYSTTSGVFDVGDLEVDPDKTYATLDDNQLVAGAMNYFVVSAFNTALDESGNSEQVEHFVPSVWLAVSDGTSTTSWIRVAGTGNIFSVFDLDIVLGGSEVLSFSGGTTATSTTSFRIPTTEVDVAASNVSWSFFMLQPVDAYFVVDIFTTNGSKRIFYRLIDTPTSSGTATATNLYFAIGTAPKTSGSWTSVSRNLQTDLQTFQPTNNLIRIDNFWVYAKGMVGGGETMMLDNLVFYSDN